MIYYIDLLAIFFVERDKIAQEGLNSIWGHDAQSFLFIAVILWPVCGKFWHLPSFTSKHFEHI